MATSDRLKSIAYDAQMVMKIGYKLEKLGVPLVPNSRAGNWYCPT